VKREGIPLKSTNAPAGTGRLLLRAYAPVAMIIGLGSLALLCLAWWPAALVLGLLPLSGSRRRRIGRGMIFYGLRAYLFVLRLLCFVRIDAGALASLRAERRLVIVANHPSLLDAVMLVAELPNAFCVMKASLLSNPMYGAAARLAHYVSNASAWTLVNDACAELRAEEGAHLVVFPEGTRTTSFPVNPCGQAGALIAQRAHVPIQVVYIDMSTPYLGKHWPLFKPPQLPLHCRVTLGPRHLPEAHARELTARIEDDLARRPR
jgi:1-acyl-sn-glycerol-3-phosphate acyltransferase